MMSERIIMINKILKIALVIILIAVVCFGAVYTFLYFSDETKSDYASLDEKVIGTWDAISCMDPDGKEVMNPKGNRFVFEENQNLTYFTNFTEKSDYYKYSWKSDTEMEITSLVTNTTRTVVITFDANNNMIVNDPTYNSIWTLKKSN